jgi:segregation and condensation protein B
VSRKRKQRKSVKAAPAKPEAVPEEVLAEGSGPHAEVEAADAEAEAEADVEAGSVAAHVGIDTAASEELAEAAKAVGRRRKRRGKAAEPEPPAVAEEAVAGQSGEGGEGEPELAAEGGADAAAEQVAAEAAAEAAAAEADEAIAAAGDVALEGDAMAPDDGGDAVEAASDAGPEVTGEAEAPGEAEEATLDAAADGAQGDDEAAEPGAVLPTSAASMDAVQLKHLVEALVFASDKPLTVVRLRQLTRVSDTKRLEQALESLAEDFRERGIVLQQVSGGYQFRTRTQFSAWVQQLIAGRPVRLSRAQLETLAIIAYRQPITRPEIDEIRGVDSSATLKLLIDRALIRILGKKEEVGRPMLYGTTKEFLDFFSLGDLRELPTLREYSELTDESRRVMSDRLGIGLDETARASDGDDGEGGEGGGSEGGDPEGGDPDGGNGHGGFEPDGFENGDSSNGHDEASFDAAEDATEEAADLEASDEIARDEPAADEPTANDEASLDAIEELDAADGPDRPAEPAVELLEVEAAAVEMIDPLVVAESHVERAVVESETE